MTNHSAPQAPPFCPNPACNFHRSNEGWSYVRDGFHTRKAAPHCVQRFRCCHCRRSFSEQTFRTTYWLKRPDLLEPIMHALVACSCLRQLGRSFGVSPQTILLHGNRLGRHCLLFHEVHRPKEPVKESLALDGFQSFEYSQFYPTYYNVVAGTASHFFYGFSDSELRRSGAMTKGQKKRRDELEAELGKPDPRAIEDGVAAVLVIVCPKPQTVELHTDEHSDYPRAIKRLKHLKIAHHTISSRAARTEHNPLFAINLLDLLIRHSGANHKRETIAFAKRRQMAIWRLWVFLVWRNYIKWFSENKHEWTPAMKLGITKRKLKMADVLKERLFVSRIGLPECWGTYYWGGIVTRALPRGRKHRSSYAF